MVFVPYESNQNLPERYDKHLLLVIYLIPNHNCQKLSQKCLLYTFLPFFTNFANCSQNWNFPWMSLCKYHLQRVKNVSLFTLVFIHFTERWHFKEKQAWSLRNWQADNQLRWVRYAMTFFFTEYFNASVLFSKLNDKKYNT